MAYSEMEQPLIKSDRHQIHLAWFVTLLLVLLLALVFSLCSMIFSIKASKNSTNNTPTPYSDSGNLPKKYLLDSPYILPPTNQSNIGTCWSFASMYILEAQYRAQGIAKGYLNPDEYVSFSEQAYFTWLHDQCKLHPEVKACHYGGLMKEQSSDQEIESLYYFLRDFKDLHNSIVPFSVCPYRSEPSPMPPDWSYFWCPDLDKALERNPISFKVKSMETAYDLNGAKDLLWRKKRALGIGAPLPNLRYYRSCSDEAAGKTPDCINKLYSCPPGYDNDNCQILDIDSRQRDGVFLAAADLEYVSEMGGHAMNIVGWNDDWILRSRYFGGKFQALKGGFILHNSWRGEGHSVEYLMDQRSIENENTICPNHRVSLNWIPALKSEVIKNPTEPEKMSVNFTRIRGNGVTKGADALKCKNEQICNMDSTYFLRRKEWEGDEETFEVLVDNLPNGLNTVHFVEVNKAGDIKDFTLNQFPFWHLYNYFEPANVVENDPDQCGYWILPYQSLEQMRALNWDLMDNFRAFDLEVEFDESSYARSKASKDKDTSYLLDSTHKMEHTEFDGPLPFDKVF